MNDTSKPKIDITMTAVLRPLLLSETLISIKENICQGDDSRYRLIINIDPIGLDVDPLRIVKTAKKNFDNVVYNIPDVASFPRAVKWVWSQTQTPYIFHIEDDWILNKKIDIDSMIDILKKYDTLSSLRLSKFSIPRRNKITLFDSSWVYNIDGFYLAKDWKKQFGLNPILIKKQFIDQALPKMVDHVNPEKQFRESQKYMRCVIKDWKYGMYGQPGDGAAVKDIGRRWINNTKYHKPKTGPFLTWEKR